MTDQTARRLDLEAIQEREPLRLARRVVAGGWRLSFEESVELANGFVALSARVAALEALSKPATDEKEGAK